MTGFLVFIIYSPYLAGVALLASTIYYVRKQPRFLPTHWDIGFLALFLWSLFVHYWNDSGLYTLSSAFFLFFWSWSQMVRDQFNNEEKMLCFFRSIYFLSLGSAAIASFTFFQWITYEPAWWKFLLGTRSIVDIHFESYRTAGTFNNPNLAGTWYACMVLIGFYLFTMQRGIKRVFYFTTMLFYLSVLGMTESRGAILGLAIGFIFYFYFIGYKKWMSILVLSSLAVIAIMLYFPSWFPRGDILYSSIQDRQMIWQTAFSMFTQKPWTGWGLFGIYTVDNRLYYFVTDVFHAHNLFLTFVTTLGIVGCVILFWMLTSLYHSLRVLYQEKRKLTPLFAGIIGMTMGQNLVDFTLMSPQIAILFVTTGTFVFSLCPSEKKSCCVTPQCI